VFDTTVYVAAMRGGPDSHSARLLRSALPWTHLSAVVAAELRAGATNRDARRAIANLVGAARAVGRHVTPTLSTWLRAGEVMNEIRDGMPQYASKLPRLWNDVLIALCGAQIGATVFTSNRDDFELVRRHTSFALEVVEEAGGGA
jgi:predicted nucleic acid-binding protein